MTEEKGSRLVLILADSEIELVPKEYWSHPAVVNNARKRKKKPSQVLLDSSLHHSIFKNQEDRSRRGRPDIVHQFLLLGLDSILNLQGRLVLKVHTRNDELIHISPSTRLPKNYNRYSGLFEELFRTGTVPSNSSPLINLEKDRSLKDTLESVKKEIMDQGREFKAIVMDPSGERQRLKTTIKQCKDSGMDLICVIGGFSDGSFKSRIDEDEMKRVSLPGGELKVWTVISEVLVTFRHQ